jgi:predicted Zn-dependent protease
VQDIVAQTERGLLLTCLWYIREVDPQSLLLTGLTRDGVFLVEQGEVVGSVTNFRFNESPVGMLRRVTAAGRAEDTFAREFGDYFTRTRMPALRIAEFNMSSVSPAS